MKYKVLDANGTIANVIEAEPDFDPGPGLTMVASDEPWNTNTDESPDKKRLSSLYLKLREDVLTVSEMSEMLRLERIT